MVGVTGLQLWSAEQAGEKTEVDRKSKKPTRNNCRFNTEADLDTSIRLVGDPGRKKK